MDIKEKIVVSSTDLIVNLGVRGFTMDDVATNLGMSKRTLYEHFKDKKELIAACVEYMIGQQTLNYEGVVIQSETVIHELFSLFKHMDENYNKRGKVAFDIKKYYPDIHDDMYLKHYKASCDRMKVWLDKGVEQEVILPDIDIDLTVYVINETVNNLALRPERIISTNLSLVNSFKYVILYFFRGISTNKGVELIDSLINKEKIF